MRRISMSVNVTVSGDVKAVISLEKQILFAAKQAVIGVAQESQGVVIDAIKRDFTVRGTWYEPSQRFGVHVRFSKSRDDLSATVESGADWLVEHELGEDKTPDKHDGHLTVPHAARPSKYSVVPTSMKARRILPNASLLGSGKLVLTSARPSKSQGKRQPKFKETPFFLNKAGTAIYERLDNRRLLLVYTLTEQSHIRKDSTVVEPTIRTVELRVGPIFSEKLEAAIKTAK